jgi:hypothetical protein
MPRRPILMGKAERVATDTDDTCSTVLTRPVLEAASSQRTDDGLVSITSKCHRSEGVKLWFRGADGRVLIVCAKCSAAVAWLQIANGEPE